MTSNGKKSQPKWYYIGGISKLIFAEEARVRLDTKHNSSYDAKCNKWEGKNKARIYNFFY